jgi:hypothetical protein
MKGVQTRPELPLGFQSELRHFGKTRRALDSYLQGPAFGKEALGPRGALTIRGGLDPSFGAFDAFQADHLKALESIRSSLLGVGSPAASELIAGTPKFADITTGVGAGLHDDIAKTARMVGFGGLSGKVEESARIAMGGVGAESKAFGVDPDFVRDASSIAFGQSGRTGDLIGDAAFGAMGVFGKHHTANIKKLTRSFGSMPSRESTAALAGLRGVFADQDDFLKVSRETMRAIRGVTSGFGAAENFDLNGYLPAHRQWGAEELSLIGRGIVDQARLEKLSSAVLTGSGSIGPDISEMTRGIFERGIGPWAKGGIFGAQTLGSAFELSSVLGVDGSSRLRGLEVTAFGAGLDPTMTRGLIRDLGAEFDFACGFTDGSMWTGLPGFTSPTRWSDLLASAEAALDVSVSDVAEELDDEDAIGAPTPAALARRMRERGFWLPVPTRRDGAFWLNFLVAVDTVSEAIAAGDPRKVLFALMSLAALTMTWPGDSRPRD